MSSSISEIDSRPAGLLLLPSPDVQQDAGLWGRPSVSVDQVEFMQCLSEYLIKVTRVVKTFHRALQQSQTINEDFGPPLMYAPISWKICLEVMTLLSPTFTELRSDL